MPDGNMIAITTHSPVGKITEQDYFRLYKESIDDPNGFWGREGRRIDWIKPYTRVMNASYDGDVSIKWYEDGTLNASVNCIDRHLATKGDQTAILWEGDDPGEERKVTYREMHEQVCRLANVLKSRGVKKGDRVTIYMPMIPEAAFAMLACARIGAVHSVVFGGFSPDSLAGRIEDCHSTVLITADEGLRGSRKVPLKRNADAAMASCPVTVETCIVVRRTGGAIDWVQGRDIWYHEACVAASPDCPAEEMSAEDPLFILYTSG
jgi:acetyl-CoA synthetase